MLHHIMTVLHCDIRPLGVIQILHYDVTMPAHLHTPRFIQQGAQELCEIQLLTMTWVQMSTLPLGLMARGIALVPPSIRSREWMCAHHAHSHEIKVLIMVESLF